MMENNNSTSNHAGERIISDSERKERWQRYLRVPEVIARLAKRGAPVEEGPKYVEAINNQEGVE